MVIPGENVDTDVMYPGQYLNIEDPQEMKLHLFEGFDAGLRDQLGDDVVLVTGENFGIGSSREHVPLAIKAWGVRCVLGRSFARIFRRNCINLGLLALACPEAAAGAASGSRIRIDVERGEVQVDGARFQAPPIPELVLELHAAGGLVGWARERTGAAR